MKDGASSNITTAEMGNVHMTPDRIRQRIKSSGLKQRSLASRHFPLSQIHQQMGMVHHSLDVTLCLLNTTNWKIAVQPARMKVRPGHQNRKDSARRGTPNFGSLFLADGRAPGIPQPAKRQAGGTARQLSPGPLLSGRAATAWCRGVRCLGCERPTAGGCACTCIYVSGLIYSLLTNFTLVSYSFCWRSAPPRRSTCLRDKMNQADSLNEHDTCFTTTDVHNPTKNGSHRLTPSPTHPLCLSSKCRTGNTRPVQQ